MFYNIVYILGNLFMAYIIYKYVHIFYSECKVTPFTERVTYFGYFLSITLIHIVLKAPLIVFLSNIVLIFLMSLLYIGKVKKAMLSTVMICFSLMCIETAMAYLTNFSPLNIIEPFKYESAFGIVAIRIMSYAFVLLIYGFENIKNLRNSYPMPSIYWLSLIFTPCGTIVMMLTIFMCDIIPDVLLLVCIGIAFAINIVTFYLYDKISSLIFEEMNKKIAKEQQKNYEQQIAIMESSLKDMRMLRHD